MMVANLQKIKHPCVHMACHDGVDIKQLCPQLYCNWISLTNQHADKSPVLCNKVPEAAMHREPSDLQNGTKPSVTSEKQECHPFDLKEKQSAYT